MVARVKSAANQFEAQRLVDAADAAALKAREALADARRRHKEGEGTHETVLEATGKLKAALRTVVEVNAALAAWRVTQMGDERRRYPIDPKRVGVLPPPRFHSEALTAAQVRAGVMEGQLDPLAIDGHGHTLLHYYPELAEFLIGAGTDPSVCDMYGVTPLHKAAQLGACEGIEALLRSGINIDRMTMQDKSALGVAVSQGNTRCAQMLIEKGAAVSSELACLIDNSPEAMPIAQLLIDAGATVPREADQVRLCKRTDYEVVELLLTSRLIGSADALARALEGHVHKGNAPMVLLLLAHGAVPSEHLMRRYVPYEKRNGVIQKALEAAVGTS